MYRHAAYLPGGFVVDAYYWSSTLYSSGDYMLIRFTNYGFSATTGDLSVSHHFWCVQDAP